MSQGRLIGCWMQLRWRRWSRSTSPASSREQDSQKHTTRHHTPAPHVEGCTWIHHQVCRCVSQVKALQSVSIGSQEWVSTTTSATIYKQIQHVVHRTKHCAAPRQATIVAPCVAGNRGLVAVHSQHHASAQKELLTGSALSDAVVDELDVPRLLRKLSQGKHRTRQPAHPKHATTGQPFDLSEATRTTNPFVTGSTNGVVNPTQSEPSGLEDDVSFMPLPGIRMQGTSITHITRHVSVMCLRATSTSQPPPNIYSNRQLGRTAPPLPDLFGLPHGHQSGP